MKSGLETFFDAIRKEVRSLQERFPPLNCLVLTGGGVRLDGFLDVVKESISSIARIGVAQGTGGPEALIQNPAFSAALGGIWFMNQIREDRKIAVSTPQHWFLRTVEAARNWIFEYF